MKFEFAEIPKFTNEWDDLSDAILEAKGRGKSVIVPCGENRSPSSLRQSIRVAMKQRGLVVHTVCATDLVYVWFKGRIREEVTEEATHA